MFDLQTQLNQDQLKRQQHPSVQERRVRQLTPCNSKAQENSQWSFQKYCNSDLLHRFSELAVLLGLCQVTSQHFSEPTVKYIFKRINLISLWCKSNFSEQLLCWTKVLSSRCSIIIVPRKGFVDPPIGHAPSGGYESPVASPARMDDMVFLRCRLSQQPNRPRAWQSFTPTSGPVNSNY